MTMTIGLMNYHVIDDVEAVGEDELREDIVDVRRLQAIHLGLRQRLQRHRSQELVKVH